MKSQKIFLDTDVVVNWLVKEIETASDKELWKAPHEIIKLVENKAVIGMVSLTTLMEIRFLLRRKKSYTDKQVEDDISKLSAIFEVIIPDEINLLKANALQAEYHLDPFDAIHLSILSGLKPVTLVSRDKEFLRISKKFVIALSPEEFFIATE
ncbi:MAG: PIN domain-containing protein [Nitrospirota bacterium]